MEARALLRGRSVTYFADVYILSALCAVTAVAHYPPALSRERERGERFAQRRDVESPLDDSRPRIASCNLLLLSGRYRLLPTGLYKRPERATFTEYPRLADPVPLPPFSPAGDSVDRRIKAYPASKRKRLLAYLQTHTGRRISRTTRRTVPVAGLVANILSGSPRGRRGLRGRSCHSE